MIYPDNIEDKLGFDQIRSLVSANCMSELGQEVADRMKFEPSRSKVEKYLLQTEDFRQILVTGEEFPQNYYFDIGINLTKIKTEGTYLAEEEMYDLGLTLGTISACIRFLDLNNASYPHLYALSKPITFDTTIHGAITNKYDLNGRLKDSASAELANIRIEINKQEKRLRKTVEGILKTALDNGYSPEGGQVSVRDGRLVIPVLAENKRRIKGVVQDESSTGQTVFIEPTEVIEVNNELTNLRYREKREIIQILTALSDQVRPAIPGLLKANRFLGNLDFIRAKARFAIDIEASMPEISSNDEHELKQARHPLLLLHHRKLKKEVVPLDLELSTHQRIILISGPNAGGKSVSLKTTGLLQYMFQCGLLIPADESSKMKLFDQLFVDIGDEQSIENDLSTYSSHLKNLKQFVEKGNDKTLFLIDEFGTGTEPQFGGSIAEVILERLNQLGCYGVVTTHYANLKKLADKHTGIVNAAMSFDVNRLEPLYRLSIGKPGSSFALEIAASIGLDKKLIGKAKNLVGYSHVKFDKLVNQLESERNEYKKKLDEVTQQQQWLQSEHKDYSDLKEHLENERKAILDEAKREGQRLLTEANKKIEKTIKEIREAHADKERTRRIRQQLKEEKSKFDIKTEKKRPANAVTSKEPLKPGDQVKIKGQESTGQLVQVKGKKAEVLMGSIKSLVAVDKLEKVGNAEQPSYDRISRVKGINYEKRVADFNSNLDLRGQRASEAVAALDSFLDQALVLGISELRIIHGKGNGILRDAIRTYLKDYDYIEQIKDEHIDLGGAGVSVVTLK